KNSMAAKQRSCPGVGSEALRDPCVIWRKLDCLKPSLQKMQLNLRRNDARTRRHDLRRYPTAAAATSGSWSDAQRGYSRRRTGRLSRAAPYGKDERGIA